MVLISTSAEELSGMIEELLRECQAVGLEPNYSKTKVMTNSTQEIITINNNTLTYVDDYVYLGQVISFNDSSNKEILRRISLGWKKYWSLKFIMKGNYEMQLKKLIFDSCVLPVVLYGSQTWSLTKAQANKVNIWQRAIERSVLKIRKKDKVRCTKIRGQTNFRDANLSIQIQKWKWAGHLMRYTDERWARRLTDWTPYNWKRSRGRQPTRWRDVFKNFVGHNWTRIAQDREKWHNLMTDFTSQ